MSETNVGQLERLLSVTVGGALIGYGLSRRSLSAAIGGFVAGAPLISRGWTGHCPVYEAAGVNTAPALPDPVSAVTSPVVAKAAAVLPSRSIEVEERAVIDRPVDEVFRFWSNFTNLPRFMNHLENVTLQQNGISHWVAKAPLGTTVEWDAEVTDFQANERISWRSKPGTAVPNEGTVTFAERDGGTEVCVKLQYQPPAGALGATIAKLFGEEPSLQVADDLNRFKEIMEAEDLAVAEVAGEKKTSKKVEQQRAKAEAKSEEIESYQEQLKQEAKEHKAENLEDPDAAVDQSFPASDPPARW